MVQCEWKHFNIYLDTTKERYVKVDVMQILGFHQKLGNAQVT